MNSCPLVGIDPDTERQPGFPPFDYLIWSNHLRMNGGSSAVALAGSANRHSRFTLVAFDTCTPAHSYDKPARCE